MAEWLDKEVEVNGEAGLETNGDWLRNFIENLWKAVVELLNAIGEWHIDL
ncbi:MAG: hypothetical protein IJE63_08410 [Clostridia bacterium]|nr:hypothetical protein [Clostridia bacterium]